MSGIVGIVNPGVMPVDEPLLRLMTDSLAHRGPDKQQTWLDGPVGFGHTLLSTTTESEDEAQPASLDGRAWITADARVDGRAELVDQLASVARGGLREASDAELILHAYHAWAENCVEHLLGDFAFAIWDGPARRLFCARDHFGVKPFYYARIGGAIVFSNSLDCVRLHPAVRDGLNELAIGDFLLFGFNQDPTTTTFADVHRLPPAHCLTVEEGAVRARQYWTLPTNERIRYRRSHEYVDRFKGILSAAVDDRLRVNHVGVWMSGGLDSTSIAATAAGLGAKHGTPVDLHAHTVVYDTLIPDEERDYAGIAAKALGVHPNYMVADGYGPFDGWDQPELLPAEPTNDPFLLMSLRQLEQAASDDRVLLSGDGGDEVLWRSFVVDLLGKMPLRELGADIARSVILHRRRPAVDLRARVKKWLGHGRPRPAYPTWLNPAFTERLDLRVRWEQMTDPKLETYHSLRPEAHWRLAAARWSWYFESLDPGATRVPVEGRYPFLDLRLVSYLLAIPPIPWCVDKHLLRVAMQGVLPDSIRLRAKAPLGGDPLLVRSQADAGWLDGFDATPELARWVDRAAIPRPADASGGTDASVNLRPLCLNYWLKRQERGGPVAERPIRLESENTEKKTYRSPRLETYGDIRDITQAGGMTSRNSDGGHSSQNKTG